MSANEKLIQQFYTAFGKGDYKTMQQSYSDNATFSDPVFEGLSATEARAMWEMLITSAKDLRIEFSEVSANETSGTCLWQATYTFTTTGRLVHNIIRARFEFTDGKISKHTDRFDFWRWSKMALGASGLLLGWTPLIKKKVQETARHRLEKFMAR